MSDYCDDVTYNLWRSGRSPDVDRDQVRHYEYDGYSADEAAGAIIRQEEAARQRRQEAAWEEENYWQRHEEEQEEYSEESIPAPDREAGSVEKEEDHHGEGSA